MRSVSLELGRAQRPGKCRLRFLVIGWNATFVLSTLFIRDKLARYLLSVDFEHRTGIYPRQTSGISSIVRVIGRFPSGREQGDDREAVQGNRHERSYEMEMGKGADAVIENH